MENCFGLSDQGCDRLGNEDAYFMDPVRKLFIVADGMGGYNAGDVASNMTVQFIDSYFSNVVLNRLISRPQDVQAEIFKCLKDVCTAIYNRAEASSEYSQMGTTCVIALVTDDQLHISHVGDSRAYLFCNNAFKRLTRDHTLPAVQAESGQISKDQTGQSRFKNKLTQALGRPRFLKPGYLSAGLNENDQLLLCSDGLSDMVNDQEMEQIFIKGTSPENIGKKLVKSAIEKGGHDNITAVIYRHTACMGKKESTKNEH